MSLRRKSLVGSIVLGLALVCSSWLRADDEEHLAKAPAAVQAAVKKLIGSHKLEGFDKENDTSYEVNYKVGGTDYAAIISDNGEILENEVEIDMSAVPAAVLESAKKKLPDGKIGEVAIVTAGGKMFYELDVKIGKDTHEIKINADGSVIDDTIEKPEAKAAGEKDEKDEKKEGK